MLFHSKEADQAHTNALVLETIGDIPMQIRPPQNVLFLCKLNPLTQDEDLFTIFSRFGTVTSAEIIWDYKTGDSLCYAFIEFGNKEDCQRAYFKMDNTLIDDRRIHVDFSQGVSELWGQLIKPNSQKSWYNKRERGHADGDCRRRERHGRDYRIKETKREASVPDCQGGNRRRHER